MFLWVEKPRAAIAGRVLDEALAVGRDASTFPAADEDYFRDMDGGVPLTPEEIKGRNTWIVWTAGNDRFWDGLGVTALRRARFPEDAVVASQPEDQPRSTAGSISAWSTSRASSSPPVPIRSGTASGWISARPTARPIRSRTNRSIPASRSARAARRSSAARTTAMPRASSASGCFPNPDFDEQAAKALGRESLLHRPELLQLEHAGAAVPRRHVVRLLPRRPEPDRSRRPTRRTRSGRTSARTSGRSTSGSIGSSTGTRIRSTFVFQLFHTSRPGSLDTSLISTDNINNPRTMNAVYQLLPRLLQAKRWGKETLAGGGLDNRQFNDYVKDGPLTQFFEAPDTVWTPRVLKDGADSVGALGALNRVYHQHRHVQRGVAAALQRAGRRQARLADRDRRRAEELRVLQGHRSADARHGPVLPQDHRRAPSAGRARRRPRTCRRTSSS